MPEIRTLWGTVAFILSFGACQTAMGQDSNSQTTEVSSYSTGSADHSDAAGVSLANRVDAFRDYLKVYRRENRILSFSVAVMKDDEIVLLENIGWQDHDAEEPTVPETSYLIASITKTFTAATLIGMEADGHIDLDADFTSLSDWDSRCEWMTSAGIIFGG